jgi:hypothetical protein
MNPEADATVNVVAPAEIDPLSVVEKPAKEARLWLNVSVEPLTNAEIVQSLFGQVGADPAMRI